MKPVVRQMFVPRAARERIGLPVVDVNDIGDERRRLAAKNPDVRIRRLLADERRCGAGACGAG
jgi:hypothetical protein